MQFRQLRYFVKIVEAGSFSRAATTVHVAQPALSQQIAELEQRMGVTLLYRSARGVKPTAAGETLYREASLILRQLEHLPATLRSSSDDATGSINLGIASALLPKVVKGIVDECRAALPRVTLRMSDSDSLALENKITSTSLDLAIIYEDEPLAPVRRTRLFRQRLHLFSHEPRLGRSTISASEVAAMPLVLPGPTSARRKLIDRTFADAKLRLNVALEADSLATEMWAVRNDIGCTILPVGDVSNFRPGDFAQPILIEPAMYLTCSIISSSDLPLTPAGEATRACLLSFFERRVRQPDMPGLDWIGPNAAFNKSRGKDAKQTPLHQIAA